MTYISSDPLLLAIVILLSLIVLVLLCVIGGYIATKLAKRRAKSVDTPRGADKMAFRGAMAHQRQASESLGDGFGDDDEGDDIVVDLPRMKSPDMPKEGVRMLRNASSLMYGVVKDGLSLTDLLGSTGDTADGNTASTPCVRADEDKEIVSDSPRIDTPDIASSDTQFV